MRARVDEGSGTCKRFDPAWHEGGITSGGGVAARCDDTFPLSSKAGASTRAGKCSSSPWWPRAEVQALVKCGGAARRC
jgi:hypothetical protein